MYLKAQCFIILLIQLTYYILPPTQLTTLPVHKIHSNMRDKGLLLLLYTKAFREMIDTFVVHTIDNGLIPYYLLLSEDLTMKQMRQKKYEAPRYQL